MRAVALALLVLSCGGGSRSNSDVASADLDVTVEVEPGAPEYVQVPDLVPRVRVIIEKTARYFGHDPSELAGLHIVFVKGKPEAQCLQNAMGCWDEPTRTIWLATDDAAPGERWTYFSMVESIPLPHELLHILIGDPEHRDPRWSTFWELYEDLHQGRTCTAWEECPAEESCACPYMGQWLPYYY